MTLGPRWLGLRGILHTVIRASLDEWALKQTIEATSVLSPHALL